MTINSCLSIAILAIMTYYFFSLVRKALKDKKVQHRWYFLEKNKQVEFATRKSNPVEYWVSFSIYTAFFILAILTLLYKSKKAFIA